MKPILITGGNGFLGAWIARVLVEEGRSLRVFDRSIEHTSTAGQLFREIAGEAANHVEWMQGDVTDGQALTNAARGCGGIIHLAARKIRYAVPMST